jgi:hypothetical protein
MLGVRRAAGTTHTSAVYKQQVARVVHAAQGDSLCLSCRELVSHPHFFPMFIRTVPPPRSPRADAGKAPRRPVGPVGGEALDQRSAVTDTGARGSLFYRARLRCFDPSAAEGARGQEAWLEDRKHRAASSTLGPSTRTSCSLTPTSAGSGLNATLNSLSHPVRAPSQRACLVLNVHPRWALSRHSGPAMSCSSTSTLSPLRASRSY